MQLIVKTVSHHLRELERSFYGNAKGPSRKLSNCLSSAGETWGLAACPSQHRQGTQGSGGLSPPALSCRFQGSCPEEVLVSRQELALSGKTDSEPHPTHLIFKKSIFFLIFLAFCFCDELSRLPTPSPFPPLLPLPYWMDGFAWDEPMLGFLQVSLQLASFSTLFTSLG